MPDRLRAVLAVGAVVLPLALVGCGSTVPASDSGDTPSFPNITESTCAMNTATGIQVCGEALIAWCDSLIDTGFSPTQRKVCSELVFGSDDW
jgi:hypothetical protein